jgi:hypothetical protein
MDKKKNITKEELNRQLVEIQDKKTLLKQKISNLKEDYLRLDGAEMNIKLNLNAIE